MKTKIIILFLLILVTLFSVAIWNIPDNILIEIQKVTVNNMAKQKAIADTLPNVLSGSDGFLFYKEELDAIRHGWPDNTIAFNILKQYLDSLGVVLYVVPLPLKLEIYGEKLYPTLKNYTCMKRYDFMKSLNTLGIKTIDLLPALRTEAKKKNIWLKKDTHWAQPAIIVAAKMIAKSIKRYSTTTTSYYMRDSSFMKLGELQTLIGQNDSSLVTIKLIISQNGIAYCNSDSSAIMLFGDSFIRTPWVYSANLAAHLGYMLHQQICCYMNLGGNMEGIRILRKMSKKFVKSKRVIVWVFSSRFLQKKFIY
jgi:SGNH hydrolase-like domain, acetyltransferase AlgX